ncbi:tripartite tricarboxylate transporter substrate-binding protein [Reyranella sp.]|uniref:tripartite tricarboxylate transporter substrate-binding protein n=1 Tax=Reyranella sp. TaxID=1929291 RepID=UPI0025F0D232|nr:tripartite tricarboxylate transporter substrate-binding protein [Reyranella sp.]
MLLGSAYGQVGRDREKDLRIFVGFEPGGGADQVARTIASQLQRRTSRRVIVENRTGQFGAVPGELVKKAPPDGAELALLSSTTLVSRLASKTFPFDPAKDLAPITKIGNFAIAFAVAPQLPVDTFKDYLAWIQEGDDQRRRIAVSSNTTFVEVLNVLLSRSTRQRLEPVYFRGITAILSEMRDGKIPATVNTMTSLLPPHRGRRARILLATGTRRLSTAPNIPIGPELGYPSLDMEEWFAFFAAPGTPAPLVAQLNNRLRSVIADREVTELLKPLGLEVDTGEPDELAKLIEAHRQTWQLRMATTGVAAAN